MKQEDILKELVKELFNIGTLHQEYQDNDSQYVIDSQKTGDILTIKVQFKEDKCKKEFEKFVDNMDDELFNEVWESLSEEDNLHTLNELYDSPRYKEVIEKFKARTKKIVANKIKELQAYL